ncbi:MULTISPECIES: sodium:proton exchanger [Actinomadura]|uniref:Sodium:proton exchanger n=1 Tax=Actinomadura yumaensis TaxID=111807 RepID=A0ABW2CJB2_9ACTN|nr:sodium:proton exchanger [Actinomadura sp. J1-007]MWK34859.1 sodium:proton exchanger [Actinomadura sp. J1-007]
MAISRDVLVGRVAVTAAVAVPAVVLRLAGVHVPPVAGMFLYGAGVLAAAVLLMWAAETARVDMSGALALALLALIAVLPEYAVDLYYAYRAGSEPAYTAYAAANMTGANRLLVGVGWALVVLAFALGARRTGRHRQPRGRSPGAAPGPDGPNGPDGPDGADGAQTREAVPRRDVHLSGHHRIELGFLAIAAVIAFIPSLTAEIGWYVSILLIALYVAYILRIARSGGQDAEELVGVPERLAALPAVPRRVATWGGFLVGALIIFASAEPFAESLVEAGSSLGIDEFLLVQWLAPLASEAPELIVAVVFAWRLRDNDAIGALLSSKINQWTLLIGTLPLAYKVGGGDWSLPLDSRQTEEVLLTAAQTVLGLALLIDLYFRRWEAALLFALFAVQFVLPGETARLVLSGVYLAIGFTVLGVRHRDLGLAMGAVVLPLVPVNRGK